MKFILLIFLASVLLSSNRVITDVSQNSQDTIEFVPSWDFKGRCDGDCYVHIAGDKSVETVNGLANKSETYYSLFVKCPTKFRFQKGKKYKFLGEKFKLNSCSTIIDTITGQRIYCLTKELK